MADNQREALSIQLQTFNRSTTSLWQARTHNGHKESIAKSCYQKLIRRGMFEQALYFYLQGLLIPSKSKRSNQLNRIVCILSEEVSIGHPSLLIKANEVLSKYRNEATAPDEEDFREIVELL